VDRGEELWGIISGSFCAYEDLSLQTTNAPITGNVEVWKSLVVETTRYPIDVHARLVTIDAAPTLSASFKGSTSLVKADLTLDGPAGSEFRINGHTDIGGVNLNVLSAPEQPLIFLTASARSGGVIATLPPTFEGRFSLSNSLMGKGNVVHHLDQTSTRKVKMEQSITAGVSGEVYADTSRKAGAERVGNVQLLIRDGLDWHGCTLHLL